MPLSDGCSQRDSPGHHASSLSPQSAARHGSSRWSAWPLTADTGHSSAVSESMGQPFLQHGAAATGHSPAVSESIGGYQYASGSPRNADTLTEQSCTVKTAVSAPHCTHSHPIIHSQKAESALGGGREVLPCQPKQYLWAPQTLSLTGRKDGAIHPNQ